MKQGFRLGPYEILGTLGSGGMGEVYRARDPRLNREIAVKVLPGDLASDAGRLKRFEKEARSASALNHPNIVTIYEIGSADSVSYIAMELVEGKTLRELLFAGPLPIKRVLQLSPQVADGLARAHEAGIVHRDLKPENVMVTKDARVKILDFGLAKLAPGLDSAEGTNIPTETGTGAGVILGTVGYMSPEQASGQPVDFRSDQFSFGSILYELVTGKRAFQKKTGVETLSAIIQGEPEPIGTQNPEAPAPLRWIVERCLAKDPDERYGTTRDLARDLVTLRDRLSEAGSGEALIAAASRPHATLWKTLGAAALVGLAVFAGKWIWKAPPPSQPSFQRLTFRSGFVNAARFSHDGRTIVYSARWDGEPPHVFLTRPEAPESQRLDLPDANLVSISSSGEVAIVMGKIHIDNGFFYAPGTLATAPLAGGAPREIAEDVRWADWSPDGKRMLVVRSANAPLASGGQLEFPVGKVIHRGEPFLSRFSPAGDRVAYLEDRRLHVTDLSGHELEVVGRAVSRWRIRSLAWSPSGEEIWFVAVEPSGSSLRAVSLAGKERVLLRMPHDLTVEDVSKDGRMLLGLHRRRKEVWAGSAGEARERNLTIFGDSDAMGFSADGKMLLDNEQGGYYLRRTDGSPPKKLGEGFASELSADGKWAALIRPGPPAQVVLVPTGAGEERLLERGAIEEYTSYVRWSQDGRKLLFFATEKGLKGRLYLQEVAGGLPRPVTPDGMGAETASISPDGRFVIVQVVGGFWMYPTDGGERRQVAGFLPTDYIWKNWSEDGRFAYAWNIYELPFQVFRVELATGRREPWKTIMPQDPVGIWMADLMLTPDGKSYAYNCSRDLSDLYLVEGLK